MTPDDKLAAEAALRLGDEAHLDEVLRKFVRVEPAAVVGERLVLLDGYGQTAFVIRAGASVGAAAALLEAVLRNLVREALS